MVNKENYCGMWWGREVEVKVLWFGIILGCLGKWWFKYCGFCLFFYIWRVLFCFFSWVNKFWCNIFLWFCWWIGGGESGSGLFVNCWMNSGWKIKRCWYWEIVMFRDSFLWFWYVIRKWFYRYDIWMVL